jgi:hypothetical protein
LLTLAIAEAGLIFATFPRYGMAIVLMAAVHHQLRVLQRWLLAILL